MLLAVASRLTGGIGTATGRDRFFGHVVENVLAAELVAILLQLGVTLQFDFTPLGKVMNARAMGFGQRFAGINLLLIARRIVCAAFGNGFFQRVVGADNQ